MCSSRRTPALRQRRDAAQPARPAAEELRNPVCPAQIQMRVVLPGDADTAEHLDAVLGVGLGRLDARWPRRPRRRWTAADRRSRRRRLAASPAATAACSERSSISAHMCLMAWKLPIGLPNCSRTFAYSVAVRSVQRASPAASAASTVAARSSTRCRDTGSTSAGASNRAPRGPAGGRSRWASALRPSRRRRRRRPEAQSSPAGSSSTPPASAPSTYSAVPDARPSS